MVDSPNPDFVAGSQPDPAFEAFHRAHRVFDYLAHVHIPGMDNPSWDRRVAWLFWTSGLTMEAVNHAPSAPPIIVGIIEGVGYDIPSIGQSFQFEFEV